jgi:hypothetical protein
LTFISILSFALISYLCPTIQDHPKDAEFLNCPIRFYCEMEAIFANAMATGKFVLGSGEALGQNLADSAAAKADDPPLTHTTVPSE